ncbi:MAG: TetR/AcrR family transcriptional regulator [bacterium]|nr:TetR/AcrR family transcriptional regulator [bacterium]
MKKTEKEQQETKDRILLAAKKEFAAKGFSGARMGSIAKMAEANQALIHYYFENKDNLYKEVLIRLLAPSNVEDFLALKKKWNMTPSENLQMAIYVMVTMNLEADDQDTHKIIAREMAEEHRFLKSLVQEYYIPQLEILEEIIEEGVRQGEFATKNPLLEVFNLIFFFSRYNSDIRLFEGTKWHDKFFGENMKEKLMDFALEHAFKALKPEKSPVVVEKMPEELIRSLDDLVLEMKKARDWSV